MPDSNTQVTDTFEDDLSELILTAFGHGADIEGEWTIDVPVSAAPNWMVTIEKRPDDEEPSYEPTMLDD